MEAGPDTQIALIMRQNRHRVAGNNGDQVTWGAGELNRAMREVLLQLLLSLHLMFRFGKESSVADRLTATAAA